MMFDNKEMKDVMSVLTLDSLIGNINEKHAGVVMKKMANSMKFIAINATLPRKLLEKEMEECETNIVEYLSLSKVNPAIILGASSVIRVTLEKILI